MATYKIDETGLIHIGLLTFTYAELQAEIDSITRDLTKYTDAMEFMREHLTLEQANARYASDVQTAWAQIGVKGGGM